MKSEKKGERLSLVARMFVAAVIATTGTLLGLTTGATAATAEDLLHNSRVILTPNAQADLRAGKVDARVIDIVTELARDHKLSVSVFISGHDQKTASGNVSHHWYGRAVDIYRVDDRAVNSGNTGAQDVATRVKNRTDRLRPAELGQPWWNAGCGSMSCFTKGHGDHIHIGYAAGGGTAPQAVFANVNACGALYIKLSAWGSWQQHMGCGQAKSVSISPDGNTIAVVRPDNTLVAKDGLWANWATHTGVGDTQAAAAGPGGMLGNVNACGALYIKTSYWGSWTQHMGCGQAKAVSLGADGQTIAVVRPDNTLVAKNSLWGSWTAHVAVGDTLAAAAGPSGMLANINACGALYVKTSYWGSWTQHMGCGQAKKVALGPDGQSIAVVRPDNTLVAKTSLWGGWAAHTGVGDSQSAAVARF